MNRFAVAFLLAALACGCGMQSGASSTPTAGATTSAAPTSTISAHPSEAPSSTPDVAAISFERVFAIDAAELTSIAMVSSGFLAGGCDLGREVRCKSALVLRSPDGRSWSKVELPNADGRRIFAVAQTPLGLLALGMTVDNEPPSFRAVWRSVDGTSWEPFTIPAPPTIVFEQVVVLPDRTVFVGADYAYDMTVATIAWATIDGSSWTSGATPISPKVAAQPGLVAIGNECVDVCPPESVNHVFRSSDGFSWTEEPVPVDLAAAQISSLGVRAGRAIVGGTLVAPSDGGAFLWHDEPPGWRQTDLPRAAGYSYPNVLVIGDRELVVAQNNSGGPAKAWWSADGMTYTDVELSGLGDRSVGLVAGQDPVVLVVDYREIWLAAF